MIRRVLNRFQRRKAERRRLSYIQKRAEDADAFISPNCTIDDTTQIEDGVFLFRGSHCPSVIGRGTYTHSSTDGMKIGRFCSIADGLRVITGTHPTDKVSSWPGLYYAEHWPGPRYTQLRNFDDRILTSSGFYCEIGNDVWIGSGVYIKGGVVVGDGAVIGMGSVVTKNVPPYAIVAGCPAKIIRYRFNPEVIAFLQSIKWWDWPLETIKRYADYFESPEQLKNALIQDGRLE